MQFDHWATGTWGEAVQTLFPPPYLSPNFISAPVTFSFFSEVMTLSVWYEYLMLFKTVWLLQVKHLLCVALRYLF